ncbi:hypothetical protein MJO29_011785 [Puccinia striiformis f. sp. tritici]|nr:hypothetical protein MJO29_011785 [Puccinia striiformis f. sp. tritici]
MSTTSRSESESRSPARPCPQVDPSLLLAKPARRTHSNARNQHVSWRGRLKQERDALGKPPILTAGCTPPD